MKDDEPIPIVLRRQNGDVAAVVVVDPVDAVQAGYRWYLSAQGYAARRVIRDGRRLIALLHREILGLAHGDPRQGDHIDGNRFDYRRRNLRIVTPAQNSQNVRQAPGSSNYRGVCWHKRAGKWAAYGEVDHRREHLGLFADELMAARVAREWRAERMSHANEDRHG